jgi:SAM-dependent methyltransferase
MKEADIALVCQGKTVLDVGCGRNKFPGAVGIDFAANSKADVRHDLNVFPYPLAESRYQAILLRNVIEHLENVVRLMEEVHRVGVPDADVIITTPHFSSLYSYQDPTHIRHLALESMDYFIENTKHSNFYSDRRFRIMGKGLDFGKSFPFSLVAKMLFVLSAHKYEKHFAFVFPANSLWFHLRVVK